MKPLILLINIPRFVNGKDLTYENITAPQYPPLNLAYLAAFLEQNGYLSEIIDLDEGKNSYAKLEDSLRLDNCFLVGLTFTTPLLENAKKTADKIKQIKNIPIVVGGIHASLSPLECISYNNFNYVIEGEGEIPLLKLANYLTKSLPLLSQIGGLNYKVGSEKLRNINREKPVDLDTLPFPKRDLFLSKSYKYPDTLEDKIMPIMTSRGCPGLCTYCCSKKVFPIVRLRTAKNIVDEIEDLVKKYGVKEIHIWDDNFTVSKKRVLDFCTIIKERGLKLKFSFPNGVRADSVDYNVLSALKSIGTYSLGFGVESGNEEILRSIKKGITKEKTKEVFDLARKVGLETWGFFMLGLYGETKESIYDTINFAKELNTDIVKFNILMPFPGTEEYNRLEKDGLILEKDFSKYGYHSRPVHKLKYLEREDLEQLQKDAYFSFYCRPKILLRQILRAKRLSRLKSNFKIGLDVLKIMLKK